MSISFGCIVLLFFLNSVTIKLIKSQITSGWATDNSVLFPGGVGRLSYAATDDDIFYVFAGSAGNFKWNPSSPTILTTLSTSTSISHCWSQCAAFMPDKRIYLMGMEASDYGAVEIFDTESEQFISHNISIPSRLRVGCVANDYENGLIYYYGGQNSSYQTTNKIFTTLQVYNIYTEEWRQLASNNAATSPFIRNTCCFAPAPFGGVSAAGYLYTFGGTDRFDSVNGMMSNIYRYDIEDDSWAQLTASPLSYSAVNLRSIYNDGDDKIYIMGGGTGGDDTTNIVNQFDPQTNNIIGQYSMSNSVSDFAINIYNGEIRVWAGRQSGDHIVLSNTQFAPITTSEPTVSPTSYPTSGPTTNEPSATASPTNEPTTNEPSTSPTNQPITNEPTISPTNEPTTTISPTTQLTLDNNANKSSLNIYLVALLVLNFNI